MNKIRSEEEILQELVAYAKTLDSTIDLSKPPLYDILRIRDVVQEMRRIDIEIDYQVRTTNLGVKS